MALFAIGDIHLGFGINKTMDKFGENWKFDSRDSRSQFEQN